MYKVILIDDEKMILDGLQKIVDWSYYNCQVCATATTAEDAIEKIIELSPDIIFTDIKMKSMSGLEMLEEISEYIASSKIVIMTAHRNFEYAHKAIELRVSSFLLKPTTIEDINNVLEKITSELNQLDAIKQNITAPSNSPDIYTSLLIEKSLSDILTFNTPDWKIIDSICKSCSFNPSSFVMSTISIKDFSNILSQEFLQNVHELFKNIFPDLFEAYIIYPPGIDELNILITSNSSFALSDIYSCLIAFQKALGDAISGDISIGCSSICTSIKELKTKYHESRNALAHRSYIGDTAIIFFDDISSLTVIEQYYNEIQQELFDYILSGDTEGLKKFMPKFESRLQFGNDINYMRHFSYDTLKKLYTSYQITHTDVIFDEKSSSLYNMIFSCITPSELLDLVKLFSYDMSEKINSYTNDVIKYKLKNAIRYIEENYMKQITRDDIAYVINVTPNYVSSLFKKGTNMTLIEYITKVRITKAKELLSMNKYKHYEISYMVGFNDNYYFSKTFKKYTGVSPLDYQRQNVPQNKNSR